MSWISNVLYWCGKTYMELKVLAQGQKTWKRLSWEFLSSAADFYSEDYIMRENAEVNVLPSADSYRD